MAKTIQVKGIGNLLRGLRNVGQAVGDRQGLEQVGNYFVTKIKKRTAEGRNVEGRYFKPYTPQYAFFRRKKGLPTDRVDLFFTGSMMNSLTYDINFVRKEVKIFFAPGTDKKGQSNPAKAAFLQQDRNFFGMAKGDEKAARRIYQKRIAKGIARGF